MKKFLNYALYSSLLVTALVFTSCQNDIDDRGGINEQQTLLAGSATVQLMERTVSNDGSFDNIVDGSSCFDIHFPYTVSVHGVDITINSRDDIQVIEELFDAIDGDEDILDIIFPVTVTMADFTDLTINGIDDLRELAAKCIEGGDDDDIECIDFVYPITVFTFDTNAQQTGEVSIGKDRDLRRFFAGLDGTDLVSIDFPIALEMYDGTEIHVSTNAELADALERAKNACDEDDDNDHNDDDFTKERLDALLVHCPWSVVVMERDNQPQTDQYKQYLMRFAKNGSVTVIDRMGNSLTGTWNTRVTDWKVLLKLEFEVLVDFNLEWFVYEIVPGKIKLFQENGNKVVLNSACDIVNQDPTTLRDVLTNCKWIIKKVKDNDGEIRRLLGYEFEFMAGGMVTLTKGDVVSQGSWEISTNAQGRLVMAIVMGQEPGVSFEWPLSDLRDALLTFEIPGTDYELILQRVCGDNADDPDVVEIRNIMMGGNWMVANYTNATSPSGYNDFSFNFGAEHLLTVTTVGVTDPAYAGLWRVIRNSDQKLKVYLNLGDMDPLGNLTDDWDFVSITPNRIELKDVSGDGTISILVFERQ